MTRISGSNARRGTALLSLAAALATLPMASAAQQQPKDITREVSERYLELDHAGDFEGLAELYGPGLIFHDPTGDVFNGPVARGPVEGAEAVLAMQRGWGLAEQDFDVDEAFFVGEYAVHHGTLTVRYQNGQRRFPIPFVTVHQVVDRKVVERTDFGEYVETFGLGDHWDANTASTREIADRALAAYLTGDLDTQAEVYDEGVRFQDPTSRVFGPPSGLMYEGKDELLRRRTQIYQNVQDFDLDVEKSFYQNHHAVYMGKTSYRVGQQRWVQPAVFVFEVRDGKVTRQWDFVDYTVPPIAG